LSRGGKILFFKRDFTKLGKDFLEIAKVLGKVLGTVHLIINFLPGIFQLSELFPELSVFMRQIIRNVFGKTAD